MVRTVLRNILIIVVLLAGILPGRAQIILNSNCQAFTDQAYFNPDFIRRNKIRSMSGRTSSKKENDVIRDVGLIQYFEFDNEGRVVKQMYSHHAFGMRTDTTTIMYIYDEKGRLITRRQNDNFSFYSYNYEYDSAGNVIKETYNRDENCGPSKYQFKLGNQYEIISERFKYVQKPGKRVKIYYNNFGREYQQREYYYDKLNYLQTEKMIYSLTGRQTMEVLYTYNEQGHCTSRTEANTGGVKTVNTYVYDKQGNLLECENLMDNVPLMHRELLYDKSTMLLNATISKDVRTNIITIVKFTYEFR